MNCTVASNGVVRSGWGGGLYSAADYGEGPVIKNTILGDNSGALDQRGKDVYGHVQSRDYNLVENPQTDWNPSGPTSHNIIGEDPLLDPLAENDGDTETHALDADSPAVDSGSCTDVWGDPVTVDQRGVSRPQGSDCDIGAYELTQLPEPTLTLVATPTTQAAGSPVELTATVLGPLGQPVVLQPVVFSASPLGVFDGGGSTATAHTNLWGVATTTLNSSQVGTTTVTAQAVSLQDSVVVTFVEPYDPVDISSVERNSPVVVGETVYFYAYVSGTGPFTYTWDFGGAGTASGADTDSPEYVCDEPGFYSVHLTVESPFGSDQYQTSVRVLDCRVPEIVGLASDSPVTLEEALHVAGTEPYTYSWDFGGDDAGSGAETATPTGADEAQVVVAVTACDPVKIVSLRSDSPVTLGEVAHFTATVEGDPPISYEWDFDSDGTPEMAYVGISVATYTYSAPGTYTATLVAVNSSLHGPYTDTKSLSVTVEAIPLFLPIVAKGYGAP